MQGLLRLIFVEATLIVTPACLGGGVGGGGIRVATYNVNGINIPAMRRAIFQGLRGHNLDFCCIQVTHGSDGSIQLWQRE